MDKKNKKGRFNKMKCFLSTRFKLAKVELDDQSKLINGGLSFREDIGSTVDTIVNKYSTEKYKASFSKLEV
jgi:hypothetical protein